MTLEEKIRQTSDMTLKWEKSHSQTLVDFSHNGIHTGSLMVLDQNLLRNFNDAASLFITVFIGHSCTLENEH